MLMVMVMVAFLPQVAQEFSLLSFGKNHTIVVLLVKIERETPYSHKLSKKQSIKFLWHLWQRHSNNHYHYKTRLYLHTSTKSLYIGIVSSMACRKKDILDMNNPCQCTAEEQALSGLLKSADWVRGLHFPLTQLIIN